MKHLLFIFTFLLFPLCSGAQIHSSIDLVGGYDFENSTNVSAGIYNTEVFRPGYRAGLNFNVRIYKRLVVKSGLRYVRLGFYQLQNRSNTIDEYYFEVPLMLRYEVLQRSYTPYIEAGFSPILFHKARTKRTVNGQTTVEDFEIEYLEGRRFRLIASVAVGFQVDLAKKYQLFIQTTLRHMKSISTPTAFKIGPRNIGVEIGVRRALSFVEDNNRKV